MKWNNLKTNFSDRGDIAIKNTSLLLHIFIINYIDIKIHNFKPIKKLISFICQVSRIKVSIIN